MASTTYIQWNDDDDDFRFVLDQHAFKLDLYSASSLKQHCAARHIATQWHIILIQLDISLHSDTLSWFMANQCLLLLLKIACLA